MSYGQADLVREVLQELLKLEANETPAAEDTTAVNARVPSALAELAARNVIYIADASTIEDAQFNPLVTYLAAVCAPKFGVKADPVAKREAEATLRTLSRIGKGTGARLKVDSALLRRRRSY